MSNLSPLKHKVKKSQRKEHIDSAPTHHPKQGDSAITSYMSRLSASMKGDTQKRYNIVLPQGLFDEIQCVADNEGVTVVDILRRFIKLGLLATWISERPDAALVIKEGDSERELLMFS